MGLGEIWGFIRDGPSIKFTSSLIKNIKCTVFSCYNITELNIFHYSLRHSLPFLAHALIPSTFHEDTFKSHISPPPVLQSLRKSIAVKSESVLLSLLAGPTSPPVASEGASLLFLGGIIDLWQQSKKCLNFVLD